jgi:hypothetical protein
MTTRSRVENPRRPVEPWREPCALDAAIPEPS